MRNGISADRGAISADIVADSGDWSSFEPVNTLIESAIAALNAHLQCDTTAAEREAVIALACDAEVRRLNLAFRAKDTATNVLSFPADGAVPLPPGLPVPLGDVVLAAETLLREATDLGIPPRDHLAHLVVHGVLHLLGHDHDDEGDAVRMEALETAVLARLDIADPYGEHHHGGWHVAADAEEDRQPLPSESL